MPPASGSIGIGSRPLERTPIRQTHPDWIERCTQHRIVTVEDLFMRPDASEELDLHEHEMQEMLEVVACAAVTPFRSSFALLQDEYGLTKPAPEPPEDETDEAGDVRMDRKLASMAPAVSAAEESHALLAAIEATRSMLSLDRRVPALRINKGITEIVGPAGIGKTQACLTLCAETFLPEALGGMGGGVVYIDSEGAFSADRLIEIAQLRHPEFFSDKAHLRSLIDNVLVQRAANPRELNEVLARLENTMLDRGCKLVILDSVAFLVRGAGNYEKVSEVLGRVSSALKSVSEKLRVACVVTNQVQRKWRGGTTGAASEGAQVEASLGAALGVAWAHAVNTRLLLAADHSSDAHRFVTVAKSPMFASARHHYLIMPSGFEACKKPPGAAGSVTEGSVAAGSVLDMGMQSTHAMPIGTRQ